MESNRLVPRSVGSRFHWRVVPDLSVRGLKGSRLSASPAWHVPRDSQLIPATPSQVDGSHALRDHYPTLSTFGSFEAKAGSWPGSGPSVRSHSIRGRPPSQSDRTSAPGSIARSGKRTLTTRPPFFTLDTGQSVTFIMIHYDVYYHDGSSST